MKQRLKINKRGMSGGQIIMICPPLSTAKIVEDAGYSGLVSGRLS